MGFNGIIIGFNEISEDFPFIAGLGSGKSPSNSSIVLGFTS